MSAISEAIYELSRKVSEVVGEKADDSVDRIDRALFKSIRTLWDENDPDGALEFEDKLVCDGAWRVLASLAKEFDLEEELIDHDEQAESYL